MQWRENSLQPVGAQQTAAPVSCNLVRAPTSSSINVYIQYTDRPRDGASLGDDIAGRLVERAHMGRCRRVPKFLHSVASKLCRSEIYRFRIETGFAKDVNVL